MPSKDSLNTRRDLVVGDTTYAIYSLRAAEENGLAGVSRLPASLKVLLENLLRNEGPTVSEDDLHALADWVENRGKTEHEIAYRPARVLMQDFTGVPAVVDLAAMRDAMRKLGADPDKINPLNPVDLVIDHSVMVDHFGTPQSFGENVDREYERNGERYRFLRWGSSAFHDFRVVPPGTGICHQVNLEYLAQTVWTATEQGESLKVEDGAFADNETGEPVEVKAKVLAYPDTCVGTDSHTTMVNGLSVLGWGVGGIEAEAAMLGQPIPMLIPEVIGFKLTGQLPEGATATDLVLTVTQMLRKKGVVGKFVEYYGDALAHLTIEDQATIGNMAPEYGATCGFFPVSAGHHQIPDRDGPHARPRGAGGGLRQGTRTVGRRRQRPRPVFSDTLELDLSTVQPSLAGPKRPAGPGPAGRRGCSAFKEQLAHDFGKAGHEAHRIPVKPDEGQEAFDLGHGDVVIAAITSCTNTSNPTVLIAAGPRRPQGAREGTEGEALGEDVAGPRLPGGHRLPDQRRPAGGPGCAGLQPRGLRLHHLHRQLRPAAAERQRRGERRRPGGGQRPVRQPQLRGPGEPRRARQLPGLPTAGGGLCAGRLHAARHHPRAAGDGLGRDSPCYLRDIWPTSDEIATIQREVVTNALFATRYADVFKGDQHWQGIQVSGGETYAWEGDSTYVQNPPYFEGLSMTPKPVTRHPGGPHPRHLRRQHHHRPHLARRQHLQDLAGWPVPDRPRRGRGRLQQLRRAARQPRSHDARHLRQHPHQEQDDAGHRGRRDQALSLRPGHVDLRRGHAVPERRSPARRVRRQGIRHRLVARLGGQGHAPARRACGRSRRRMSASTAPTWSAWASCPCSSKWRAGRRLGLTGEEIITVRGLDRLSPRKTLMVELFRPSDHKVARFPVTCRIDTETELDYFKAGGVMPYVLRNLARSVSEPEPQTETELQAAE